MTARISEPIRRAWLPVAAVLVFLVLAVFHAAVFRPLRDRYQRDLRQAARLGMPFEAGTAPVPAPGVVQLFTSNSLDAPTAEDRATSGVLTAALLDQAARLAAAHGLEVRATEQDQVTQLPNSVEVRAHLRLRGRYASFVQLVDELARSSRLISLDRFQLHAATAGPPDIELWVSQIVFKSRRTTAADSGAVR